MALSGLELQSRPVAEGRTFGDAGAYEELKGTATFALDPAHPLNQRITDLELAPPDAAGRVGVSADVMILRPADPSKRNRKLLLDIVNRGNPSALRALDLGDRDAPGIGEGWLLQQGYTIVRCGWQHDVPRDRGLGIDVPDALDRGGPISGPIMSVFEPDAVAQVAELSDRGHRPYPAADVDEHAAKIVERPYFFGPETVIPRDSWRFARLDGTTVVLDANYVYLPSGFQPGRVYEIVYTAIGAPVTGAGFAATRDFVSFLRFGNAAAGNPCAGEIDHALAFGASQTGRFLRQMLYLGFCEDEDGRQILDGLLPHIAGARLMETNWRFGQPSYIGPNGLSSLFPFTDAVQTEPGTGVVDGVQKRAIEGGKLPKVIYTNTSWEYWASQSALTHLAADLKADAVLPDNARIYFLSGTQHSGAPLPVFKPVEGPRLTAYPPNTIDYRPLLRAAFRNLEAWVCDGIEPPGSAYPTLAAGTLVNQDDLREPLAALPGPGIPAHPFPVVRLDFGDGATRLNRATVLPPVVRERLPGLVSAVDADGNEVAGVRHPEIAAPLATYTGWNPRHEDVGGTDQPRRQTGATIPFARTFAERERTGDPRPSIEERYESKQGYLERVRDAADGLASERYLLRADIEHVVGYEQ